MNWDKLISTNQYGESAVADVQDIVYLFTQFLKRRGSALALPPARLVKQILKYIHLRQTSSVYDISAPQTNDNVPVGWTSEDEDKSLQAPDPLYINTGKNRFQQKIIYH